MKDGRDDWRGLGGRSGEGGGGFARGRLGSIYGFGHCDCEGGLEMEDEWVVRDEEEKGKGLSEANCKQAGQCGWVRSFCILVFAVSIPFHDYTDACRASMAAAVVRKESALKMVSGTWEGAVGFGECT